VTQTTLSVDETAEIVDVLRARFPALVGPRKDDICYATTNRQRAVKEIAEGCDLVLVIGSRNSSNSKRLVEVARTAGARAELVEDPERIDAALVAGAKRVGLSSGASAPDDLVQTALGRLRALGVESVREVRTVEENMFFPLPNELKATRSVS
jgi:4-hydroxy-3-methylbut-2-enyl diphosphate reductase